MLKSDQKIRAQAATLALVATLVMTVLKMVMSYFSHSIGMFSEAIHSSLDMVSAFIAYFTIREAGKPADRDHPFGHGKIETLSGFVESILLLGAGAFVLYESIDRYFHPVKIEQSLYSMGVLFFSLLLSMIVYFNNIKAAKKTHSVAIEVNALHFLSDVVSSFGVLVGLVLVVWTDQLWIDALTGFCVGLYIMKMSIPLIKSTLIELVDTKLPDHEVKQILDVISLHKEQIIGFEDLRTRRGGSLRHIDFSVNVCSRLTVQEAHDICDQLEEKISEGLENSSVKIHVEPCTKFKDNCKVECPYGK